MSSRSEASRRGGAHRREVPVRLELCNVLSNVVEPVPQWSVQWVARQLQFSHVTRCYHDLSLIFHHNGEPSSDAGNELDFASLTIWTRLRVVHTLGLDLASTQGLDSASTWIS
jgi:hypothetical protein